MSRMTCLRSRSSDHTALATAAEPPRESLSLPSQKLVLAQQGTRRPQDPARLTAADRTCVTTSIGVWRRRPARQLPMPCRAFTPSPGPSSPTGRGPAT